MGKVLVFPLITRRAVIVLVVATDTTPILRVIRNGLWSLDKEHLIRGAEPVLVGVTPQLVSILLPNFARLFFRNKREAAKCTPRQGDFLVLKIEFGKEEGIETKCF